MSIPQLLDVTYLDDELCPTRAHPTDAGLDLRAAEDYELKAGIRTLVSTGVSVKIPVGYVGLLIPRSSLSKKGITMTNSVGVIDSDYRGEIMASLMYTMSAEPFNFSTEEYIRKYDRIVQLVIVPIALPQVRKFDPSIADWDDTIRGSGGFGSTGTK